MNTAIHRSPRYQHPPTATPGEFAVLAGGALLLIVVAGWLLGQVGGGLARLPVRKGDGAGAAALLVNDAGPELQACLDRLAVRLVQHIGSADGMQVQVHFSGGDTFNAFATLWR